ncbi:MAG: amidophosphoribosyltransferase, partial [Candidatus Pacebacteria bacterium]|nr:amidophosphoribosyltransferase [Candidatus Paceibacterota bacterium]
EVFPFRPQLEKFKNNVRGKMGIGVIGDYEPQPLIFGSKFRKKGYGLVHVGKVNNLDSLVEEAYKNDEGFNEMSLGGVNPVELIASLINKGRDYADGIEIMQNSIEGSSSVMLLSGEGVYVARDKFGRTPINIGQKEGATGAAFESFSLKMLGFDLSNSLGPGEIGIITDRGYEQLKKPEEISQLCGFLHVYYGGPAAVYNGVVSELARNNLGAMLAKSDKGLDKNDFNPDHVAGIPDSGTGSAIGYSNESKFPLLRTFVKYTETWQRSFMPQNQEMRKFVAQMKLIPIEEFIRGKEIVFSDDSLVRGTQSQQKFEVLYSLGIKKAHFRLSCPPLIFPCTGLNFSMSESVFDLAARRAIREIDGESGDLSPYINPQSNKYHEMVDRVRHNVGVDTLKYQKLGDLVSAIGLPKKDLCTHCWDGCDSTKCYSKSK